MQKLTILWTTSNEMTIKNMVFMYAKNALIKEWFQEVKIIVWGASSEVLATNTEIQNLLNEVMQAGVKIVACLACADNLGISEKLQQLNIEVKYVGADLSDIIKSDEKLLSV